MWRVQFTAEGQVKLIVQLDTATFNDQVQLYFDVITKKVWNYSISRELR